MGRKVKYSKEMKLEVVKRYLRGQSATALANEYGLEQKEDNPIRKWARRYEILGDIAFDSSKKNCSYSRDIKEKIIKEYLNGGISLLEIASKYKITSESIVYNWIIKYNNGIEIKDYNPKSEVYTMKSRKTTFEERLEIVQYVLDNDNDYKGAAYKYSVPYASVYQWMTKYNEFGEDGLLDRRGRPSTAKPTKELTTEEKQAIEIEKLKRELERSKMVIEVLKKNIEIQERMERDSRLLGKKTNTKR